MAYSLDGTHWVDKKEPIRYVLKGTTLNIPSSDLVIPSTIALKSVSATRKIELSFDFGVEYHELSYDFTSATSIVGALNCAASHIKVTGDAGNILTIIQSAK